MNTELMGIILIFLLSALLAWPLGKYMVNVFKGEKVWTDFLSPFERFIFKMAGVNPDKEMDWKQNLKALLGINMLFFVVAIILLMIQGSHPFWNPNGFGNWDPTLAFNTA